MIRIFLIIIQFSGYCDNASSFIDSEVIESTFLYSVHQLGVDTTVRIRRDYFLHDGSYRSRV